MEERVKLVQVLGALDPRRVEDHRAVALVLVTRGWADLRDRGAEHAGDVSRRRPPGAAPIRAGPARRDWPGS